MIIHNILRKASGKCYAGARVLSSSCPDPRSSIWLMMRVLRSDWQTKFTAHAHHQPLEHPGSSHEDRRIGTGGDGEFRSALLFRCARGLSEPERPRSYAPPGVISMADRARADLWVTLTHRKNSAIFIAHNTVTRFRIFIFKGVLACSGGLRSNPLNLIRVMPAKGNTTAMSPLAFHQVGCKRFSIEHPHSRKRSAKCPPGNSSCMKPYRSGKKFITSRS
jgi:hypothetical protein